MADNSPRLDLPYIQAAQAQKHVTHNEALRVLDVLVQLSIAAFDETAPPSLPQEGDIFAIGIGAGGAWLGHDGELAVFVDGYWQFHVPQPGWIATDVSTSTLRIWTGTAWEETHSATYDNLVGVGINTTSDAINRLALSSPASLFSHEGAGHQLKINKATAGDTASLLFQTDWSGRAELGLAGDDDFHVKVSADGATWTEALTIDAESGKVSASHAAFDGLDLSGVAQTIGVNAGNLVIYDTTRDSDGGAWRHRCKHTSWYNEALNTATRGARREFPAVAITVAESNKVTIYDGDDPTLPMWRSWDFTGYSISSIAARDGKLIVGLAAAGVTVIDLVADALDVTPGYSTATLPAIVSDAVNDVAMTVLPGAPIDPVTGLPVPTIAVATDGGWSQINPDGSVFDFAFLNLPGVHSIGFTHDARVFWTGQSDAASAERGYFEHDLLTADLTGQTYNAHAGTTIHYHAPDPDAVYPALMTGDDFVAVNAGDATAIDMGSAGLALVKTAPGLRDSTLNSRGMVAYVTASYTTGWMPGDIKGAFLADTDATDLIGGTDADRSVNNNPLTVTGTVTRNSVMNGAELMAYSGFSTSNYLEQPYNSALDFGTGDFCAMGWVKGKRSNYNCFLHRNSDKTTVAGLRFMDNGAGHILVTGYGGSLLGGAYPTTDWFHACFVRRAGVGFIYLNGMLSASGVWAANVNDAGATLAIGGYWNNNLLIANAPPLALWRISATAPTAEQIRKIHDDERALFQENAACTLYGASDAVTALAHDPVTGLLHAGTSAGRSDFQGLRRVSNTTTAVTTAIGAAGSMIMEE